MTLALVLAPLLAALTTFLLTPRLLPMLRRRAMDRPNARSSHTVPTPRGGGIAVCAGTLVGAAIFSSGMAAIGIPLAWLGPTAGILALAGVLAALSWRDDRRPLPVSLRFGAQGLAVAAGLALLMGWPGGELSGTAVIGPISALLLPLFSHLGVSTLMPLWLDLPIAWLAWMWVMNATNFMDGIDGITIADGVPFCVGWTALVLIGAASHTFGFPAANSSLPLHILASVILAPALGGALLGFTPSNWPPAKAFLGDVGSIPIGYLTGFGLLALCMLGLGPAALVLLAYPLTDATLTLCKRAMRGEKVWRPHRSHAYQRAAATRGHRAVSGRVALANGALVAIAVAGLSHPWTALAGAALIVGILLVWMERAARKGDT
ncbi:MAG: glycosyl transferase [Pseudomonadota bacterium]